MATMEVIMAFDPITGALILGGIGAATGYLGQREANNTNRDIADQATATNIYQSEANRRFQREMSNTAYQRQKEDLIKAGLNPLLMTGMSGASTPAGSTAQAETATMQNEGNLDMNGIQAALKFRETQLASAKQTKEIDLMGDQQALTRAQAGKALMETKAIQKDIPKSDLINSVYDWGKNKFKEMQQFGAKPMPSTLPKEIQDFHKKYQKPNPHTFLKGPK